MSAERSVRLFRHERNQAVQIPRDLELSGKEALIRNEGDALVLIPKHPKSLLAVLRTLEPLRERIPLIEELPVEPVEL